ncbi:MAG: helix-turn-helix domain-containing protein [Reinekea sp.]|jgi:AraC-like DNA-binding protein
MFTTSHLHILVYTIAGTQALVAALVFAFAKEKLAAAQPRLLSGIFLLMAIVLLDMSLERTLFYMHHPSFGNIGKMLATALPGVVYLYARKSWSARFRFHWYDVLHGLPLLLKGSAALFGYHLQSIEVKLDYWQGGWQSSPINWPWLSATVLLIYVVQVLLLVRLVYRHHQALVQLRSSDLDRNYRLLIIFVAAYSIQLVLNFSRAYLLHIKAFDAMLVVTVIMGLWIYVVVTLLIMDLILTTDQRSKLSNEEADITGFDSSGFDSPDFDTQASSNTAQPDHDNSENEYWQRLDESLEGYMQQHKPYLNANLTLVQLAQRMAVPGRELSGYINQRLNCNFSDYIANWRIEEAKQLLIDAPDQAIIETLYACGFNSKSVFNTHFKKRTGMTPSQWRNQPMVMHH